MNDDLPYQPFYCEENVWKLCREGYLTADGSFVVVISSRADACPIWNQRAAPSPERPVFWDYHVVAVESDGETRMIWDLDSRLDSPVDFEIWLRRSFPGVERLPERFHPKFRVIPVSEYVEVFSSDRSHMRDGEGDWKHPPPDWPPIFRKERGMNLGKFIDMEEGFVGDICTKSELRARFIAPKTGAG